MNMQKVKKFLSHSGMMVQSCERKESRCPSLKFRNNCHWHFTRFNLDFFHKYIPGIRDNALQTVGQFDKFNLPVVMSGTGGIPKGHPASLGCGQFDTSTSTPFWPGFLFHTLFVIPFFLEIILGLLGCFMVKFDFDITLATTLSSFTILYLFVIK